MPEYDRVRVDMEISHKVCCEAGNIKVTARTESAVILLARMHYVIVAIFSSFLPELLFAYFAQSFNRGDS